LASQPVMSRRTSASSRRHKSSAAPAGRLDQHSASRAIDSDAIEKITWRT
jgi:hypothetical protein